jgi:hypothetical protein
MTLVSIPSFPILPETVTERIFSVGNMASSSASLNDPREALSRAQVDAYANQAGSLDACALIVELEGLPYDYAFNETDLFDLFSRYGQVKAVEYLDSAIAPDIALVEFRDRSEAEAAVHHLNNYSLAFDGFQVIITVCFYDEDADKKLQGKLRIATAMALHETGRAAVMTGAKYNPSTTGGWQCRFVIGGEMMDREFPIVGRIIGPQGAHMKSIHERTGAKLRLRGRRSNFREGPENKECDEPMHLCVSSNDEVSFRRACEMVESLMGGVYSDYSKWCHQHNVPVPNIQMVCVDGPFSEALEWKLREYYASMTHQY